MYIWDIFILGLLVINLIYIPLKICFEDKYNEYNKFEVDLALQAIISDLP
jgi:hypothetical protein